MYEPADDLTLALATAKARYDHAEALHDPDVLALIRAAEAAQEELGELRHLFELQQRRMREATDLWRAEDPAARELIMPDLGALLSWLMEQTDKAKP